MNQCSEQCSTNSRVSYSLHTTHSIHISINVATTLSDEILSRIVVIVIDKTQDLWLSSGLIIQWT